MAKLYGKKLAAWERKRDINAEILQSMRDLRRGKWARKTEFIPQRDGSMRRIITRRDGTVEKDHVIPAADTSVRAARAATGLSQAQFARLLGVSVRTLQEWEQGRKSPSGAAATLLRIAGKRPDVLKEVA
ncbi:MAG: helix-turn-helix domain-containing protein [Betaproteobacteria bacterium]|nr:helix-turn-helix domain-containing protein [Betaproteobacteria bacterium]